jgi:hypothetical protein
VARVDVAVGDSWAAARLLDESLPYAWRRWELRTRVDDVGPLVLRARASDASGDMQPERQVWNQLGYANNVVQPVPITVAD